MAADNFAMLEEQALSATWWLGIVRQQAMTWVNVEPDLCFHLVPLDHNEMEFLKTVQKIVLVPLQVLIPPVEW